MKQIFIKSGKYLGLSLMGILFLVAEPGAAHATVSNIAENIIVSIERAPGLVTGIAYALALLLGAWGIMQLKDHVDNPNQTRFREPITKLIAGGALLSLPIVYESMRNTIDPNGANIDLDASILTFTSSFFGGIFSFVPSQDFNNILTNIIDSVNDVPGLVSGAAYLLGLVLGFSGILKLKDHIEMPQQVAMREGVTRLLTGGALFALPSIYVAMYESIDGGGGLLGGVAQAFMASVGTGISTEAQTVGCAPIPGFGILGGLLGFGGPTMGTVICNLFRATSVLPGFFTAAAYLFGLFLGIWGILKLKDHVLNPQQTSVWEAVSRFVAGGAMFALPAVVTAAYNTVATLILPHTNSGFNDGGVSGGGLDAMLVAFMGDIFAPMTVLLNWFGLVAGMVLIMIAISRLMKSAQEGPRGPGGIGTIMTFIAGGALLSFSPMVSAMTSSLFTSPLTETIAALQYTTGMDQPVQDHTHAVISAVLKFMIVLGLISFVRGIFIIRGVAEGNQQASMMAGVTHLLGGALAVNLGPALNAIQETLGLSQYGVNFS